MFSNILALLLLPAALQGVLSQSSGGFSQSVPPTLVATSLAQAPTAAAGESIGDYLAQNEDLAATDGSSSGTDIVDGPPNGLGSGSVVPHVVQTFGKFQPQNSTIIDLSQPPKEKRDTYTPAFVLGGRPISTAFTNDEDGNGYNITLPEHTCANSIVGNFESPSGHTLTDATVRDVIVDIRANAHYVGYLKSFTMGKLRELQSDINATLNEQICDESTSDLDYSGRELLDSHLAIGKGFWTAMLVYSPPGFGIAWGVLDAAITAQNNTVISILSETAIIAALGVFEAVLLTIILHVDRTAMFGDFEIAVLNLFITIGRGIKNRSRAGWSGTCSAASAVGGWVQKLARGVSGGVQTINQSPSQVDLVAHGEENC
ncbi:MAG: hypothetical protein M4579_000268 [Chaenotheca gracillima]|nr:MAG: hypothetical protein M4579_000268 [Chaenotheca gracillima]